MQTNIAHRLQLALPQVRNWIDALISKHAQQSRAVSTLGFSRLANCFPQELLKGTNVVTVSHVPFPPLNQFGMPELSHLQHMPMAGITFNDTFFLKEGQNSESLHFHELVHVVQWARIGTDKFLLAYGFGLLNFGYRKSPLEDMAYTLQSHFDKGSCPPELSTLIAVQTDAIWAQVANIFPKLNNNK